jgi:hypothetical protein
MKCGESTSRSRKILEGDANSPKEGMFSSTLLFACKHLLGLVETGVLQRMEMGLLILSLQYPNVQSAR